MRILVVSPNFHPLGSVGSVRAKALCSGFSKLGHQVTVVSATKADYQRLRENIDSDVGFESSGVTHIAIAADKPGWIRTLAERLRLFRLLWFFQFGKYWDRFPGWIANVVQNENVIEAAKRADVIVSMAAPYGAIPVGYYFKKELGKKWVIDLRDPLIEHFGWKWPSYFHWLLIKAAERKYLKSADLIVVVTNEMKLLYSSRSYLDSKRIKVFTNGIG